MRSEKRHKKIISFLFWSLPAIAVLAYTAFWYGLAWQTEKQIERHLRHALEDGIHIEGGLQEITGFPGKHQIQLAGSLAGQNWTVIIPQLEVRGFMLPGQVIEIDMPRGLQLDGDFMSSYRLKTIDYLYLQTTVPQNIPASFTEHDIRVWQTAGGQLQLNNYKIHYSSLIMSGNGNLWLDRSLQPEGEMDVTISGYLAFLHQMQEAGVIEQRQALIAASVLNSMSKTKEAGEQAVDVTLKLNDRRLYIGPLQLLKVPQVYWD